MSLRIEYLLDVAMEPGLGGQEKHRRRFRPHLLSAVAMEPGLGGQEKRKPGKQSDKPKESQWSLALAARKSSILKTLAARKREVAMEPGLGGQEKQRARWEQVAGQIGRNGAWPWRPGKAAAVRKRCQRTKVAMEPGLGGQEKHRLREQLRRVADGRNGAWPWRPGKVETAPRFRRSHHRRRNGAWPWRPGKDSPDVAMRGFTIVAMEPGLGGQEKLAQRTNRGSHNRVAMEPGLGGQEKLGAATVTSGNSKVAMEPGLGGQEKWLPAATSRREYGSQWSLALAARKSFFGCGGP